MGFEFDFVHVIVFILKGAIDVPPRLLYLDLFFESQGCFLLHVSHAE
jgi:hypothetical protein